MRTPQRRAHVAIWMVVAPLCVLAIVVGRATAPPRPEAVELPHVAPVESRAPSTTTAASTDPEHTQRPSNAP